MKTELDMTNLFCPKINDYCKGTECIACKKVFDSQKNGYKENTKYNKSMYICSIFDEEEKDKDVFRRKMEEKIWKHR